MTNFISKSKAALLSLLVCSSFGAGASTSVTSSTVSGHWTLAGSPYLIFNDVSIDTSQSLTIDPGVEVVFQGAYVFNVMGTIKAVGTAALPISFHIQDTTGWSVDSLTAGGWMGMQLTKLPLGVVDSSAISYCNICDMKYNVFNLWKPMRITNCNFYHNSLPNSGAGWPAIVSFTNWAGDSTILFELDNCNIYNNVLGPGMNTLYASHGIVHLSNCSIHDNFNCATINLLSANILLQNNKIYNNYQADGVNGVSSILIQSCYGVVSGNKIYNNTYQFESGIYCSNSTIDINGNLICNNNAIATRSACGIVDGGTGIHLSSYGVVNPMAYIVRNNIIVNNFSATNGGAINVYMSGAIITNNTIMNNTAYMGPAIYDYSDPATCGNTLLRVKNNLFSGNINTHYSLDSTNTWVWIADTFDYSNNYATTPYSLDVNTVAGFTLIGDSLTNITAPTPGLIAPTTTSSVTEDATIANFALLPTSSCIDKGDTTGAFSSATDYAGNPRIMGSALDIGAYEYNPASLGAVTQNLASETINVYPNPAVSMIFISTREAKGTIELADVTGNLMAEKKVINTLSFFDIRNLPRGIYFASWNDGNSVKAVQKIVVE